MDDFLFALGDTLTHRSLLIPPMPDVLPRLFVLRRYIDGTDAGLKKMYGCRVVGPDFAAPQIACHTTAFYEEELAALPPFQETPLGKLSELAQRMALLPAGHPVANDLASNVSRIWLEGQAQKPPPNVQEAA
jgi:hypothetical protein